MSARTKDRLAPFHEAKAEAEDQTEKLMMSIDRATKAIQSMMAQLHGGQWRVQIDHEVGLVLVAPRPGLVEKPIVKPRRGEAA